MADGITSPGTIPELLLAAASRDPDGVWVRADEGSLTFSGAAAQDCLPRTGIKWAIARTNTGNASAAPTLRRLVMSRRSAFSASSVPVVTVLGSSVMPHLGQLPGWSC